VPRAERHSLRPVRLGSANLLRGKVRKTLPYGFCAPSHRLPMSRLARSSSAGRSLDGRLPVPG
jgi:hypothetical protein